MTNDRIAGNSLKQEIGTDGAPDHTRVEKTVSSKEPEVTGNFGPLIAARLLLGLSSSVFLITLFLPAFSKSRLIFLESSSSVIDLLIIAAEKEGIFLAAVGFLLLLFLPAYLMLALFRACFLSPKTAIAGKSIKLLIALKKFGVILILVLLAALFGFALSVLNRLEPMIGAFSYLGALVLLLWANHEFLKSVPTETFQEGSKLVRSIFRKLMILAIVLSMSLIGLFIWISTFDSSAPKQEGVVTDSQSRQGLSRSSSRAQTPSPAERRERDIDRIWRGLRINNPSFDVGNYCLRAIRGTDVTLEQCLGMYMAKAEGRSR